MPAPVRLTATQIRNVALATSPTFNALEQKAIIAAVDLGASIAATATAAGTVLRAASQPNAAGANPTQAEYNALLTALRNAGIMV